MQPCRRENMKHRMKNLLKRNSFVNIYLFVLIPVFVLIISECIAFVFNHISYKNLLTQNYSYKLETLHDENMALLQNITSFAYSLSGNENFMEYLYTKEPVAIDDIRLKNQVRLLSESHKFIDSVSIVKRYDNGFVYANDRILPIHEYFSTAYKYEKYPVEFWESYSAPIQGVNLLAPTSVQAYNEQKDIYPVVYSKIGSKSLGSTLLVINIDIQKMADSVDQKLTENSGILFINNEDKSIYDTKHDRFFAEDTEFIEKINKKASNSFFYRANGHNFYVVSAYKKNSPFGYSYAFVMPVSDLFKVHGTVLIISVLLLAASLVIAFLSSKKLFDPWQLLAATLNTSAAPSADKATIDLIFSSITDLIRDKSNISEEFAKVLPLAQERYLINILNAPEGYMPSANKLVDFKYDYFCSVIIKLRPTEQFHEVYNDDDYNNISTGIYNIMQSMFGEVFQSFVIPSENNTLYILLNLPDNNRTDQIAELLSSFNELLKPDRAYINLHIGMGNIYSGMDGMKRSHIEAMNSISAIPGINTAHLVSEADSEKIHDAVPTILDINAENTIYNNLIMGNVGKAKSYILELMDKNSDVLSNRRALTQFYMQVFNVIFKAMKAKNISYGEKDADDLDTMLSILSNTSLEIHETMLSMLDQLDNVIETPGTKADINEILAYINEHYTEDIYLEGLAEQFNISPSYLSKLIKEHCGMNFVSYLASMRIEYAKRLLLETKMSITEIYTQSGFNNRTTFIRTFKKLTGLSPSDFRKANVS